MREDQISPEEYIVVVTDITLEQTTAQISEFVTSKPPEEWQDSYINYMDSMMKFNEYIVETKVLADLIEKEGNKEEIDKVLEKMESLKIRIRRTCKNFRSIKTEIASKPNYTKNNCWKSLKSNFINKK